MVIRVPYNGSLNACTHTNTSALGLIINNSDRFFIFFLIEDGPAHHHLLGISKKKGNKRNHQGVELSGINGP
jgi:hypothetical protein